MRIFVVVGLNKLIRKIQVLRINLFKPTNPKDELV
jgi:hypothetical protein